MTGLVIKLQPKEKFLVNGIVMQNGNRPARIRVQSSDVAILRKRDAISPREAKTPLKRIYYIAQLALAGEADQDEASDQILCGLDQIDAIFVRDAPKEIARAKDGAKQHKFFVVMRALKKLFPLESAMLGSTS